MKVGLAEPVPRKIILGSYSLKLNGEELFLRPDRFLEVYFTLRLYSYLFIKE